MKKQMRKQPPVDSITHTKFQTPDRTEMEKKQMRQIQTQDRGIHNNTLRQMRSRPADRSTLKSTRSTAKSTGGSTHRSTGRSTDRSAS